MLAFITALLGAPAAINALLARIQALEAIFASYQKEKEMAAIDAAQKAMNQANTSDEIKKAAEDEAAALRNL